MAVKSVKFQAATKAFGKAMRHHRSKLGLSQEALADRAQLDRSYMSQIERGIKNVTLNSIWRIAEALEVSPSDLLRLTEDIYLGKGLLFEGQSGDRSPPHAAQVINLALPPPLLVQTDQVSWQHRPLLAVGKPTVLLCDGDDALCAALEQSLQQFGFQTVRTSSGFDAMRLIVNVRIDLVMTDIRLARGNGIGLLETLRKAYPKLPVFLLNNHGEMTLDDARSLGAHGLIKNPLDDMPNLIVALKSALPA